ncbi:hypothetical protein Bpfe_024420, partial [Biomphalaria pfeifferi]
PPSICNGSNVHQWAATAHPMGSGDIELCTMLKAYYNDMVSLGLVFTSGLCYLIVSIQDFKEPQKHLMQYIGKQRYPLN